LLTYKEAAEVSQF